MSITIKMKDGLGESFDEFWMIQCRRNNTDNPILRQWIRDIGSPGKFATEQEAKDWATEETEDHDGNHEFRVVKVSVTTKVELVQ